MKVKVPNSPLAKSLVLHAIILACLVVSISFTAETMPLPEPAKPVIQATFIDAKKIAEQERVEEQAKAAERERQRQAEIKRKQERERKAKQARERKRQQELKRKAAQEAKKKREAEEARKREVERKKKAAAEQAALDRLMQEQLEAERAAQQQRRTQQVMSEVDKYRALVHRTIQNYLVEDPDFVGKQCRLNIRMASTGLVTEVRVRDGDPALCRAAQSAVLKPDKLPVSSDPDVFKEFRNFNVTVKL